MLRKPLVACLSAATLAGCASITPAGLRTAMQLDPLETPPEALSVAVSVPENLRLSDGDAVMSLGFLPADPAEGEPVSATVPLSLVQDARAPQTAQAGTRMYVLTLTPQAVAEMAEMQGRIKALKARDIDGQGALSVAVVGGCVTAPMGETLPVATWLRPDPDAAFAPLTRQTDFLKVLTPQEAQALRARLKDC